MKKIMFNDACGLTQATIDGRKKNTRRNEFNEEEQVQLDRYADTGCRPFIEDDTVKVCDSGGALLFSKPTRYKVGEVVAVAQRYASIRGLEHMADAAGWRNKSSVKAELMPHRIRITGIKAERLQDISDADCIKEGVRVVVPDFASQPTLYEGAGLLRETPREAFAALIDKVSGRGTWALTPWVVVYEYELLK